MAWATARSIAAAWPERIWVRTSAGAVSGSTSRTSARRVDCSSSTTVSRATPRPMEGDTVRAAEAGPARLARPMRTAPPVNRRSRAARAAAPRPNPHNRP